MLKGASSCFHEHWTKSHPTPLNPVTKEKALATHMTLTVLMTCRRIEDFRAIK
jgi:hypothetical protein